MYHEAGAEPENALSTFNTSKTRYVTSFGDEVTAKTIIKRVTQGYRDHVLYRKTFMDSAYVASY
jgi:hypothetical protein